MINNLVFIAASREISFKRLKEVITKVPSEKAIIVGSYNEEYIYGLENSTHFKTKKFFEEELKYLSTLNINVINYNYTELTTILRDLTPEITIFFNGSWNNGIHKTEFFKEALIPLKLNYKLISPFSSKEEAISYCENKKQEQRNNFTVNYNKIYVEYELIKLLDQIKTLSWDWNFQVAAIAAKNGKILEFGYNEILPFESYTAHFGSLREKAQALSGDLNNHDTLHAEISLLTNALKNKVDLSGATIYLNLLPCRNCAFALAKSEIKKVVYTNSYNSVYTIDILESSGKKVIKY